jgi:hypothetical protein
MRPEADVFALLSPEQTQRLLYAVRLEELADEAAPQLLTSLRQELGENFQPAYELIKNKENGVQINIDSDNSTGELIRGGSNGSSEQPHIWGRGTGSTWKPTMTLAEAQEYTKNSYYRERIFYHGTNVQGAQSISNNGINPDLFDEYSTYGPGFYIGTNEEIAVRYAQRKFEETGETPAVLGIMIDARKPKIFATGTEYTEEVADYVRQSGQTYEEWNVVYTNYIRTEGYDTVEIQELGYILVFERHQVIVISNEVVGR